MLSDEIRNFSFNFYSKSLDSVVETRSIFTSAAVLVHWLQYFPGNFILRFPLSSTMCYIIRRNLCTHKRHLKYSIFYIAQLRLASKSLAWGLCRGVLFCIDMADLNPRIVACPMRLARRVNGPTAAGSAALKSNKSARKKKETGAIEQ